MRESVKPHVDTDMEISAIETLTNANLEVDRALNRANKTLHRLLKEIPLQSEAVTKAAELNSIRDKRVYTEVYENEADRREGRRRVRQHDVDSISEDATLASNGPHKRM